MPRGKEQAEFDWAPVIGKALACICLHFADMRSAKVGEQAEFLERIGLPRAEAAKLLGTTDDSLRVLASQRSGRSGSKRKAPAAKGAAKGRKTRAG